MMSSGEKDEAGRVGGENSGEVSASGSLTTTTITPIATEKAATMSKASSFSSLEHFLLRSLKTRNRLEVDALRPVVESYLSVCREKTGLREKVSQLDRKNKALAEEKESLKVELLNKDDNEGKAAMADKLNAKNAELGEEVMQSYKENARIAQELAAKVSEITTLRDNSEKQQTEIDKLNLTIGELGARNKELLEQLENEKTSCKVMHVELDTLTEEKHKVEQSLESAQTENRKLVDMLLEMKEKEAERMNAANDFYDNVVTNANKQAQMQRLSMDNSAGGANWDGGWEGVGDPMGGYLPKSVKHVLTDAHEGLIHAACFNSKGNLIATAGADQVIKLWEPKKGACTSSLRGALGSVLDAKFSPDDQYLVAAGADGALRMWGVDSGRCKHTLTGHRDKVHCVSFASSDSRRCVSGGQDRTIRIWDLVKGYCVQTIGCGSTCFGVTLSQNGSFIYSAHFDGCVRVWDYRTGSLEKQISQLHTSQVTSVIASPNTDRYLVSSGKDNTLKVVDLVNFETVQVLESPGFRCGGNKIVPCISPDDSAVACGSIDGSVYLWNTKTGEVEAELKKHKKGVLACTWSPSSAMIVTADQKGDVIIWD